MKKFITSLISLLLAGSMVMGLAACDPETTPNGENPNQNEGSASGTGDDDETTKRPQITETEWGASLIAFCNEHGITNEIQLFIAHYTDFEYGEGKYTAAEIASVGGFSCKNIEISVEESEVVKVEYELRTQSLDTPDRHIVIDARGITKTDIPKPSDSTQMDADEWSQAVTALGQITNYTLKRVRIETGAETGDMKLDGTTYYDHVEGFFGPSERIFVLEDSAYYKYSVVTTLSEGPASREWIKENSSEDAYLNAVFNASTMVTVAAAAIQNSRELFSFGEGIYTAESITVSYYSYEFELRDFEITVSGGKFVKVVCTLVDGYDSDGDERITVDHIGSTEIEFPKEYDDRTTTDVAQVTQEQWESILEGVTNYSMKEYIDGTLYSEGELYGSNLLAKHSDGMTDMAKIYTVESGKYFLYTCENTAGNAVWTKSAMPENEKQVYNNNLQMLSVFKNDFEQFIYEDGAYTCASLDKTSSFLGQTLKNVTFTFENGALKSLEYEVYIPAYNNPEKFTTIGMKYTIGAAQEISLPRDYTDNTSD